MAAAAKDWSFEKASSCLGRFVKSSRGVAKARGILEERRKQDCNVEDNKRQSPDAPVQALS